VTTNDRQRKRFQNRIAPDVRIESVLALKGAKGPATGHQNIVGRYRERYGLTNTLGPGRLLGDQWLVLTENRVLLFAKRGGGIVKRIGPLEHALDRTDITLQWADYTEALLRKRLVHLTTSDERMNISHTILDQSGEADRFIGAIGDRAREIGLQEL